MHDFVFSDFLKEFFIALLSMSIKIVSKGDKNKTCVNKSFDIIITKYTLHVLLTFTVKISEHLPFNTREL